MREERDKFPPVCRTQLLFCYMRPQEQDKTMPTLPAGSRGEYSGHNTGHVVLWQWEEYDLTDLHTLPCLSVWILTALEDTHSLCLSRSGLTLLPYDQLLFDLSTQMAHRQIKSRLCPNLISQCLFPKYCYPDLSLLSQQKHTPPKAAQHQVFLFLSHKLVMRPNSKPTKILPSDELTPSLMSL